MIIMYAGLCGSANETLLNIEKWKDHPLAYSASYLLYKNFEIIDAGEWEDTKSDMVLCF